MEFITGYSTVVIELNGWLLTAGEKTFKIVIIDGGKLQNM